VFAFAGDAFAGGTLAGSRETVLNIGVKKADADAFAKGDINLEEFKKRAVITAY
jgi:hypothetical protein